MGLLLRGLPTTGNEHATSHPTGEVICQGLYPRAATTWLAELKPFTSSETGSYIFQQHGTLVASPLAMPQCRHKSPRVHFQQGLGLLVRIHFDILVWDAFQLQRNPYALHKGALRNPDQRRLGQHQQ